MQTRVKMVHLNAVIVFILISYLYSSCYAEEGKVKYILIEGRVTKPVKYPRSKEDCQYVNQLPLKNRCDWVSNYTRCEDLQSSIIKYSKLIFCYFNQSTALIYVGSFLLFLWLACLFLVLGTTAQEFFCPSLAVVSAMLKLSENVAGVTVLALGNGAPDIFESFNEVTQGNTELVYNELMGGGLFVSMVVAGTLCVNAPFRLQGGSFVRDCSFYIAAVFWSYFSLNDGYVELWEASVYLILYSLFLGLVVLGEVIQDKKKIIRASLRRGAITGIPEVISVHLDQEQPDTPQPDQAGSEDVIGNISATDFLNAVNSMVFEKPTRRRNSMGANIVNELDKLNLKSTINDEKMTKRRQSLAGSLMSFAPGTREINSAELKKIMGSSLKHMRIEEDDEESEEEETEQNIFMEFLYELSPTDKEEWRMLNICSKIVLCIKAPFYVILRLVIPVVNLTKINHGWSKLLYMVNCITMPIYSVVATRYAMKEVMPGVPCILIAVLISISLCIFVGITSKRAPPPAYHMMFALMGLVSSIITIDVVVTEVMGVHTAIGFVFSISDAAIGITLLAWGNSIGDMATAISLAKAGLPRMSFAGCYGGPLLNILLGLGMALTAGVVINGVKSGVYSMKVQLGMFSGNVILYLAVGLLTSLIMLPAMGFEARKSYGCYLILVYIMFCLNIFLIEFGVTHPLTSFYHQKAVFLNGTTANITQL